MSDKNFALLGRQFGKRGFQLIQEHVAQAERFRSGIRRGQQVFDLEQCPLFVLERGVGKTYRLLLAEEVRDAIARDAKKPAGHVVDRHQQAIGFHQFVEDLLQKIFDVGFVGHPLADEIAQPGAFFRDDFGDVQVLLDHRGDSQRPIHPFL